MPKLKTNKSAAKRFKITRTGKILRRRAGKRHLLSGKSRKRKRRLGRWVVLKPMEAERMARLLGLMG